MFNKSRFSLLFCLFLIVYSYIGKGQTCNFSLGNDTSICLGTPINFTLVAPAGSTAYLWDNSSTGATRLVTNYGTYYCRVTKNGTNVVVNGNFSAGNNGFTSSYTLGPTGSPWGIVGDPGTYAVTTNPSLVHNNFASFTNHTPGGGGMMVVNGSSTANVNVWCQNITVTPNTNYNFSTWVTSCESGQPTAQLANLEFFINGSSIGPTITPTATAGVWTQFSLQSTPWNSGANTNANICIVNQNTQAAGNDFALDDIFFQPICVYTDTIRVLPGIFPAGYSAGTDTTLCAGQSVQLAGNAGTGTVFNWKSLPTGFTATLLNPVVTPLDTTKYILTTELNGCKKSDTVQVNVEQTPSPSAGLNDTICEGKSITLNGNSGGAAVFSWTSLPPGFTSNSISPTLNPISTASYILNAANGNCSRNDTVEIAVNTSPVANFSVIPVDSSCNSYSLLFLNNSTNALSYLWEFGDGNFSTDMQPTYTFTTQNLFQIKLIAKNAGCEDLEVLPLKIAFSENSLFIPNSFTPNNDERNDSFYIPKGCLDSISISIYDRWGQLMKRWDTIEGFWDGKINGTPAPTGVYVYLLNAYFLSGERKQKKGTITLYR
jgi:gliding motility-associated-like protein